ncbi:MAG: efflux RND transporter periplasmic adaptor subunit, partial [Verrucomicrobiales bacterium]
METKRTLLLSALTLALALSGNPFLTSLLATEETVRLKTAVDRPLIHESGGESKVVIKIEVEGCDQPQKTRTPLNLAIVLDRSGSMSGGKLEQAKQAAAAADNIRAGIAKKSIRAPFAGRLGIRLVQLGQILKDGEAIVSLQTVDPIYSNFTLPQQFLSSIAVGNNVRLTTDAAPGQNFAGKITAIAPEIDAVTRNVRVQATFANPEAKLRTGMFGSVAVLLPA